MAAVTFKEYIESSNVEPLAFDSFKTPVKISTIIAFSAISSLSAFIFNLVIKLTNEFTAQLTTLPLRPFIQSITFLTDSTVSLPVLYTLNNAVPKISPNLDFKKSLFSSSVAFAKNSLKKSCIFPVTCPAFITGCPRLAGAFAMPSKL